MIFIQTSKGFSTFHDLCLGMSWHINSEEISRATLLFHIVATLERTSLSEFWVLLGPTIKYPRGMIIDNSDPYSKYTPTMFTTFWLWSLDQFCCALLCQGAGRIHSHVGASGVPSLSCEQCDNPQLIVGRNGPQKVINESSTNRGGKKNDHLRPLLGFFSIHQFLQTLGSREFFMASSQGRSQTLGIRRPMFGSQLARLSGSNGP